MAQINADDATSKPAGTGLQSVRDRFRSQFKPLLICLIAALLALLFLVLGHEAVEGETLSFDMVVLRAAQALRADQPWLAAVLLELSAMGSIAVLTVFTVTAVGYLALFASRISALLVAVSVSSGALLVSLFKAGFGRLRPDLAYAQLATSGLGFPSGHTSMSAIVFLTVGALLASTRERTAERLYILGSAILLTLLVGMSRAGLGVHWASDVLGGWAFGCAWALLWLMAAHQMALRRDSAATARDG